MAMPPASAAIPQHDPSPRDDDRDALTRQLHDSHARPLLSYIYRIMGEAQSSEDIIQETLLRAWLHREHLIRDDAAIRAWLFRVAHNLAIDELRRRRVRPVELMGPAELSAEPSGSLACSDLTDQLLSRMEVHRALASLSPEHRGVLLEVFYGGLTTSEAAQVLKIPSGTAKSRLYYALRHMRAALRTPQRRPTTPAARRPHP
jgi:RNA polymerase sigma-70 factor, ECF subfamily